MVSRHTWLVSTDLTVQWYNKPRAGHGSNLAPHCQERGKSSDVGAKLKEPNEDCVGVWLEREEIWRKPVQVETLGPRKQVLA